MSEYRAVITKTGTRYMRDGKFVSAGEVPEAIRRGVHSGVKVRTCLFCGQPATKQRYVYPQSVDLCDDHYYAETIGRIAHQLKELKKETADEDTQINAGQ